MQGMVIVPLPCRWGEQGSRWEVVPCKIAQGAVVEQASKSNTQVLWAARGHDEKRVIVTGKVQAAAPEPVLTRTHG